MPQSAKDLINQVFEGEEEGVKPIPSARDLAEQLYPIALAPPSPVPTPTPTLPSPTISELTYPHRATTPLIPETTMEKAARAWDVRYGFPGEEPKIPSKALDITADVVKQLGVSTIGAAELVMSMVDSMVLYFPSKIAGAAHLVLGREAANIAEEQIAALGYQPYTREAQQAMKWIGKGFELFFKPATELDRWISQSSPEAGYLVGFGTELAEMIATGGIAKGVKAKITSSQAGKLISAREAADIVDVHERRTARELRAREKRAGLEFIPKDILSNIGDQLDAAKGFEEPKLRYPLGEVVEPYEKPFIPEYLRKGEIPPSQLPDRVRELGETVPEIPTVPPEAPGFVRKGIPPEIAVPEYRPSTQQQPFQPYWIPEANKLGVEFIGEQEIPNAPSIPMFNDPQTKTTFMLEEGKTLEQSLKAARQRFEEVKPITDIDQLTGAEIPDFATEQSPFRRFRKDIKSQRIAFEERGITTPEAKLQASIDDVNRWLDGDDTIDIATVRDDLSNLATRSSELYNYFLSPSDFVTWTDTASEAAAWARRALRSKNKQRGPSGGGGFTLYGGIPIEPMIEVAKKGAIEFNNYVKKAEALKRLKPKHLATAIHEGFVKGVVDRSGNLRREFLKEFGDAGYKLVQQMYLAKGAPSISLQMLRQMSKEVYGGLSKDERGIVDRLVLAKRMIDLEGHKKFKPPLEISAGKSREYIDTFGAISKLDPAKVSDLKQRADVYFEWMKKPLQGLLDAGLISKEEFDNLIVHNYRRLKLVEIYDRETGKLGPRRRSVYDSGVDELAAGRETDIFEPSAEVMALEVFNRSYGRIMNNEANKILLEVARTHPGNDLVRTRGGKEKIPKGWTRFFAYEEGKRKAVYLNPSIASEWVVFSPEISYEMAMIIRYASASPLLRMSATGINLGFALANLPRDIMHAWFTSRVFEGGEWKSLYSPHAPIAMGQISRDLSSVFLDATTRGKKYQDYINNGGGMEFLVQQGRATPLLGRKVRPRWHDTIQDWLGYFGHTTELMTRMAISERVIRRRAKELGVSIDEARTNTDVIREATFAARDYMDFSQGGGIVKALDNGLPYLNASIQGTRGMFRAWRDNPVATSYKMMQFASAVVGISLAARSLSPKAFKELQWNVDMGNNLCIPLPDSFGFEDEYGQMRYPYLKIPLDHGQKFFKTFFEAAVAKMMDEDVNVDMIVDSLKSMSPVGVSSLSPSVSSTLGYVTNKDYWLNEDIWRRTERPFQWPSSKEEFIPGETEQAYIDVGKVTGLSPERFKYSVEELITSDNLYADLLMRGYEEMFRDFPKSQKEQHLAMTLAKVPGIRRFIGITHPYTKHAHTIDKAGAEVDLESWNHTRETDRLIDGYLFEKSIKRSEIFSYIRSIKDLDEQDRLTKRFEFQEAIKSLPERSFWLRLSGLKVPARARVYVDRFNKSGPEERKQLAKERGIIGLAGGIISEEFLDEVEKYMRESP